MKTTSLIVFDDECSFCSYWVNFIIRHDNKKSFFFVGLQTELGTYLLDRYKLQDIDSIILIDDNSAKIHSNAILNILKNMDRPYSFLYYFHVLPIKLLDYVYKLIASTRHSLSNVPDVCVQQRQDNSNRFLYKIEELKEIQDD